MDEDKIVEAMGRAIREGDRCGDPKLPFPCRDCDRSSEGGDGCLLMARAAWDAAKAAIAEAGIAITPQLHLSPPLTPGAILRVTGHGTLEVIAAAPDQR